LGDLYVIRHAQASFGQDDYDRLSELGFRQARLLEAFFNRIGTRFQAIYSGSLKRQVVAEPLVVFPAGCLSQNYPSGGVQRV
jgi:broad specificity phosphatase PhoE